MYQYLRHVVKLVLSRKYQDFVLMLEARTTLTHDEMATLRSILPVDLRKRLQRITSVSLYKLDHYRIRKSVVSHLCECLRSQMSIGTIVSTTDKLISDLEHDAAEDGRYMVDIFNLK